jgi:hypothetical protein
MTKREGRCQVLKPQRCPFIRLLSESKGGHLLSVPSTSSEGEKENLHRNQRLDAIQQANCFATQSPTIAIYKKADAKRYLPLGGGDSNSLAWRAKP